MLSTEVTVTRYQAYVRYAKRFPVGESCVVFWRLWQRAQRLGLKT